MSRRSLYRGIVLAMVVALLAAPVAWSIPERETGAASRTLGWFDSLGSWLAEVTAAVGSSLDSSPGIDPNGVSSPPSADGACRECAPGIDPDG